jgi:hypothetical protein
MLPLLQVLIVGSSVSWLLLLQPGSAFSLLAAPGGHNG